VVTPTDIIRPVATRVQATVNPHGLESRSEDLVSLDNFLTGLLPSLDSGWGDSFLDNSSTGMLLQVPVLDEEINPYHTQSHIIVETERGITSEACTTDHLARRPTAKDVLAERGASSNEHPGNARYWEIIIRLRKLYLDAGKDGNKREIAEEVIKEVHGYGGSFLKRDRKRSPYWYEMDSTEQITKIQNALREVKNIPESVQDYAKRNHYEVYELFQAAKKRAERQALKRNNGPKKRTRVDSLGFPPTGRQEDIPAKQLLRKRARTTCEGDDAGSICDEDSELFFFNLLHEAEEDFEKILRRKNENWSNESLNMEELAYLLGE